MSPVREKRNDPKRKTGVLLAALGAEAAGGVLKTMDESLAEVCVLSVASVDKTGAEERKEVLKEAVARLEAGELLSRGGVDYARDVLEKAFGSARAAEILLKMTASLEVKPFDFLKRVEDERISDFLACEHAQTGALILASLEPAKAASVLSSLPAALQADVARRIALMGKTDPEVVRDVERAVEKKLGATGLDFSTPGGVDVVVDILKLSNADAEKNVMERLEETDPELAAEIRARMFVFDDIVLVEDRGVQILLRKIDSKTLAMALKGAEAEVLSKFLKNMSKRAGTMLEEEMAFSGPVRVKDVDEAKRSILTELRDLEQKGEIVVARQGADEFVV